MKTNVIFLYNLAENDLFAIFPESNDIGKMEKNEKIDCYASIGQHSSASVQYILDCYEAAPGQYKELKTELEGQGYTLNVKHKKN